MRDKQKVKEYNKKYRAEHKEKINELQIRYYYKNREERIKHANEWRLNNREHYLKTRRAYMKTPNGRLTSIKGSAKTRSIPYELIDSEAIEILLSPCYYCGAKEKISIDRLDSKIGYQKDNCVACCEMCNYMKNTYTKDEFISQCKLITKNHS